MGCQGMGAGAPLLLGGAAVGGLGYLALSPAIGLIRAVKNTAQAAGHAFASIKEQKGSQTGKEVQASRILPSTNLHIVQANEKAHSVLAEQHGRRALLGLVEMIPIAGPILVLTKHNEILGNE